MALAATTQVDSTFAADEATVSYGGGIADQSGNATLKDCIVWSNLAAKPSVPDKQI